MIRQAVAAMLRRAADALDPSEEPPRQRQRLEEAADAPAVTPTSLDSLNEDCLVRILSYLPTEDLNNNIPFCNQRLRTARNHESLDQTRRATLMLSRGFTFEELFTRISSSRWNETLQGNNYTHLKIVGVHRLEGVPDVGEDLRELSSRCELPGITSLDLSGTQSEIRLRMNHSCIWPLALIFPGLREVNLSNLAVAHPRLVSCRFCNHCSQLSRLVWNGYKHRAYGDQFEQFTELCLDDCCIDFSSTNSMQLCSDTTTSDRDFMFKLCPGLHRLSIKNVTWCIGDQNEHMPVSQNMLIKLVLRHPSLRWLRSDLTLENIDVLRRERPEVLCEA